MASLPIRPIVIEDEVEDEIEILGHGFPPQTLLRRDSLPNSNTRRQSKPSSNTEDDPAASPRRDHKSLVSFPIRGPQVSGSTLSHPNEASNALSPCQRRFSRPTTLSIGTQHRTPSLSMSEAPTAGARFGSPAQPLELEESASPATVHQQHSKTNHKSRQSEDNGSGPQATRDRRSTGVLNFEGDAMEPGVLIDLDELENFGDLWNDEDDLQVLRVEERKCSHPRQKPSKIAAPQRNPPITAPFLTIPEWKHKNLLIRPLKVVELHDGDFLHVITIIRDSTSGDIILRGQRLQRCRSMNGLLEKKLNEACFFHEVDLDDPRPRLEQSAVEVPLDKVQGLRSLRKTNQIFPLGRNLDVEKFRTQIDATVEGGLTARWKYTCTYATVDDRWHNNPRERALEFLRQDECTGEFGVSDTAKRFDWRGETIYGGAYRPDLEDERRLIEATRKESVVSLASTAPESEPDCVIIESPIASSESGRSIKRSVQSTLFSLPTPKRTRTTSSSSVIFIRNTSRNDAERLENEDQMEVTRKELSTLSMKEQQLASLRSSTVVDLTVGSSISQSPRVSSVAVTTTLSGPSRIPVWPKLPPTIDLSASDLATLSPTGTIPTYSLTARGSVIRSPGQMLTYGDAFCGAGGTTRGAVMAGLRVRWGFDHWNHACSTWRANFPQAKCYELSSQQFVCQAQGSKSRKPIDMKVDILHLSPPCQYFSPAHTVDCPSDEMNVASLYAVGPVIKAAKPRIVTLEQTFGIVAARFRNYFNSLIQMFTSLSFSVRWAIVPLAQWGLPQRRYRLIIIAACPGELLPAMPSPTHVDPSSNSSILPPFKTVNETLFSIPPDAPDNNPSSLFFPPNKTLRPWDGNAILPRAMTTSGGQNYHPSGKRDFTLREYAALQGFPPNHVFVGSSVKKQIGNAVPPVVAKVLFESIKRQLDERDGVLNEGGRQTMVID